MNPFLIEAALQYQAGIPPGTVGAALLHAKIERYTRSEQRVAVERLAGMFDLQEPPGFRALREVQRLIGGA